MAIQFLNNLDINDNQLLNAKVQVASTAPTAAKGQIYLDSTTDVNTLKYYDGNGWVGLKQLNLSNGTFINLSNLNPVGTNVISLRADLSATGTPDDTVYLRGDNTWAPISGIPGTYDWILSSDSGSINPVNSGTIVTIAGGNDISTVISLGTLFVNHNAIERIDTDSTASPSFGGTFTVVDSVTSSTTGHITALNLKTVTLPTPIAPTITLTGEVTGSGTTSISTTVANDVLDVANFTAASIVTAAEGIENNNNDTTLPTSAAVKAYVDASVVGGLVYQGGYNPDTNTPNLDSPPTIPDIKKGWTYTVIESDGLFFTEQVRVGDVLIAEVDSPTSLDDWTTVQNNIDIASLTQIGIGNVIPSGGGIGVTYNAGTASVSNTDRGSSQNIFKNVAVSGQSTIVADSNDDTLTLVAGSNISITTNDTADTVTIANSYVAPTTSYATTISSSDTITHGLDTLDVIIQLYDTVTLETVYADVARASTNTATITFAAAPTNPVRVLVQK